jgi:alkylation response protein AidB-like acyl-CoA dehydrogenase
MASSSTLSTAPVLPRVKGGAFLTQDCRPEEIFTREDLSEQQLMIAKTAEEFVVNEVLPQAEYLEHHKDYEMMIGLLKKAADIGLAGIDIPEEYGGMELDKVSSIVVTEQTARYGAFSNVYNVHSGIGATPITWFGTEAQKAKYLPKIAAAELISCYCLTEAHAGSDSRAGRCRADLAPDGKHYVLNGEKMWISNGGFADLFIVFAKVGGDKMTGFIIEKSFGGITPGAEEKKMGLHGASTTALVLSDCKVPVENVLGEIGRGHVIAFNCLNIGRLKLGSGAVGGMKQAIAHCIRYAKERTTFGKPIASYGLIQHKLAEMAIRCYASEGIVYRTAGMVDAELEASDHSQPDYIRKGIEEFAAECSICKVVCSEALGYCVDEAVQVYGGYGFHADYPPDRAYRDARINRIFEGTNEINRMLTTNMLLKKGVLGKGAASATGLKGLFLHATGIAVAKFGQGLADQQEVLAGLSEIAFEAYTSETATLRTAKLGSSAQAADITAVHVYDATRRAAGHAENVLAACDASAEQQEAARRFTVQKPVDTVALRRRICGRLLDSGKYFV